MQNLEIIVTLAQAGNLQAFSTLVSRFQDMAFATAVAILGNGQLAEDVAQEAFLEAYLMMSRPMFQLKTRICSRIWFNAKRRQRSRR